MPPFESQFCSQVSEGHSRCLTASSDSQCGSVTRSWPLDYNPGLISPSDRLQSWFLSCTCALGWSSDSCLSDSYEDTLVSCTIFDLLLWTHTGLINRQVPPSAAVLIIYTFRLLHHTHTLWQQQLLFWPQFNSSLLYLAVLETKSYLGNFRTISLDQKEEADDFQTPRDLIWGS